MVDQAIEPPAVEEITSSDQHVIADKSSVRNDCSVNEISSSGLEADDMVVDVDNNI